MSHAQKSNRYLRKKYFEKIWKIKTKKTTFAISNSETELGK